jgi:hypothetical protein
MLRPGTLYTTRVAASDMDGHVGTVSSRWWNRRCNSAESRRSYSLRTGLLTDCVVVSKVVSSCSQSMERPTVGGQRSAEVVW